MSEQYEHLLQEHLEKYDFSKGSIHTGVISKVDGSKVSVSVGLKSDGVIPKHEFLDGAGAFPFSVGDPVEVALHAVDNGYGETQLSYEYANRLKTWKKLAEHYDQGNAVTGYVRGRIRGGYTVDLGGVEAFVPGSLMDIRPVHEIDTFENQELQFKIIKFDEGRSNVVVSRRAVLIEGMANDDSSILSKYEPGQVLEGTVKNMMQYGAFIDLGDIDGLLHCTDMSWERVNHPSDVMQTGDTVKVVVLNVDNEKLRVSLGMKQLTEDPWEAALAKYLPQTKHKGAVTKVMEYGAFIELEPGIEGLNHLSQLHWSSRFIDPHEVVKVGQEVEVMVLEVDTERRRISLSMKHCMDNPWESFTSQHALGDRLTGPIKRITEFGIFVGLGDNIDGLVYVDEISWDVRGADAIKAYKVGQMLDVVLLATDSKRERIALGIKQLENDPLAPFIEKHKSGEKIEGRITDVSARSAEVELAPGFTARLPIAEASTTDVSDLRTVLHPDDTIEVMVTEIHYRSRRISISARQVELAGDAEALREHERVAASQVQEGGTLGDVLKRDMDSSAYDK